MSSKERLDSINNPVRHTLTDADSGQLGAAILALTREVWWLTDRMMVTENVLARRGIDITAEIEAFEPDVAMQAKLNEAGERLAANVLNALAGVQVED